MKGTVLLMRHGETAWNREGRVMGSSPVELDERGRVQVEAAVPFARAIKPELIVTSPLVRARQSAEIIATGLGGVEIAEDSGLQEVSYGRWQGMVYEELLNDADYAHYRENPLTIPTPGGETIGQVQERGVNAIYSSIQANPGKRLLFVSHGDIIRTVLCHFMGLGLDHFRRIRIDNATFSALQIVGNFAEVKFLNLMPDPARAFVSPFSTRSRS